MDPITHTQVQELVKKLPKTKLPLAYHLLQELADQDVETPSEPACMRLSIVERRRILAQQAEQLKGHYA